MPTLPFPDPPLTDAVVTLRRWRGSDVPQRFAGFRDPLCLRFSFPLTEPFTEEHVLRRFAGPRSLNGMESLFERAGAWAIVLTRSLPYSIPEAMVFLAGLAGMPLAKFTAALAIGSVPTGFVFAAIGAGWADQPALALAASYVLPIGLLPVALYLMRLNRSKTCRQR